MKHTAWIILGACVGVAATILVVIAIDPDRFPGRCQQMTEPLAKRLFDEWNSALQMPKDPDKVVQTYAPEAVLLPTFKIGPLVGRDKIRGYFVDTFLKKNPVGRIDTRTIVPAGCNMGVVTGLYTFTVDDQNVRVDDLARYTYVYAYKQDVGRWLIVHHHSSTRPPKDGTH